MAQHIYQSLTQGNTWLSLRYYLLHKTEKVSSEACHYYKNKHMMQRSLVLTCSLASTSLARAWSYTEPPVSTVPKPAVTLASASCNNPSWS